MSAGPWSHVSAELLGRIRSQYRLDWYGVHGIRHWERVRTNGLRLAATTAADPVIVEYFAALHDSRRFNDWTDPEHGPRAADWVMELASSSPDLLPLGSGQVELLAEACRTHTSGTATDDPTIGTCWDADRLDLLRVGTRPDPRYLVTEAARDPAVIAWACRRW